MNLQEANYSLQQSLVTIYEPREAANIADWVLEKLTGLKKLDRLVHKLQTLTPEQAGLLEQYKVGLLSHKPVQYVLEEAPFFRLNFFVNESVLIPRPETEELVEWVLQSTVDEQTLLDIGTGSGCIAITIKKNKPSLNVSACDISDDALKVAEINMRALNAPVKLFHCDILDEQQTGALDMYDIIVSNPPYIPLSDKADMHANVLQHEPHLALFSADDPYTFYRAISAFAVNHLSPAGSLFFEIHEAGAEAVTEILNQTGFIKTTLRQDIYGKPRMIRATR